MTSEQGVIPAKVGIWLLGKLLKNIDPGFRRDDARRLVQRFHKLLDADLRVPFSGFSPEVACQRPKNDDLRAARGNLGRCRRYFGILMARRQAAAKLMNWALCEHQMAGKVT